MTTLNYIILFKKRAGSLRRSNSFLHFLFNNYRDLPSTII